MPNVITYIALIMLAAHGHYQVEHGFVKRWKDDCGYGFIRPSRGGQKIFVHKSNLLDGLTSLNENDAVVYIRAPRKGKFEAQHVRVKGRPGPGPARPASHGGPGGVPDNAATRVVPLPSTGSGDFSCNAATSVVPPASMGSGSVSVNAATIQVPKSTASESVSDNAARPRGDPILAKAALARHEDSARRRAAAQACLEKLQQLDEAGPRSRSRSPSCSSSVSRSPSSCRSTGASRNMAWYF